MSEAVKSGHWFSHKIADFVTHFRLQQTPDAAKALARTAFIDTVAVMLAGSQELPGKIAAEIVRLEGAPAKVTVAGHSFATSVQQAAFANGVSAHAMDYDFSFALGQSAAPVVPSLLAVAEASGATTAEIIEAFVVGCEIAARLARVVPGLSNTAGWHAAGTIGAIAATAACCKLMRLPAAAIPDAIGISASMAAGLGINYGTMTKPLHVGQAARNAVLAAELARNHFTASADAIEGRTGFIELFTQSSNWPGDAFDGLGQQWDLIEQGLTVKFYPCGGLLHSGIEAALDVRESMAIEDIQKIHIGVTTHAAKRASRTEYPTNAERAKFSMPYVVAYALNYGPPMLAAFTEAAIEDERIRRVASLVSASVDDAFSAFSNQGPARITVTLANGRVIEHVRQNASGTKQLPITEEQLREKFRLCAAEAVPEQTAEKIYAILDSLPDRHDLSALWPLLRTA